MRTFVGLLACLAVSAAMPALAQEQQEQPKTAEQVYKNIQVFQGIPASQVMPAMLFMRSSLGVNCSFCHVSNTEFEKDGKEGKEAARRMIKMTREINQTSFGGRGQVTCNTCHRGQVRPVGQPALAEFGAKPAPERAGFPERKPTEPLPTVDQILDKYVQAIGGQEALQKVETRVMKGTRTASDGWSAPVEVFQKSPNKMLVSYRIGSPAADGFDGTVGWSKSERGVHDMAGPALLRVKREAELSRGLKLKEQYKNLRVRAKQTIGDREAYMVQGTPEGGGLELLYFDVQTGLLLRVSGRDLTPLGPMPDEVDYEDYRDVDGVKLPFTVLHMRAEHSYKDVFTEISQNVPVEDAVFEKPQEPTK